MRINALKKVFHTLAPSPSISAIGRAVKRLGGAALIITSGALGAWATDAVATVELNVRTGPGSDFGVLDTLDTGELVNTTECTDSGWCYVEQDGPDGWVYSSYLTAPTPPGGGATQNCELRLTLSGGTPKLELVCETPEPPPAPAPSGDEACFYLEANFQGPYFCYGAGELASLNAGFNDQISSVKLNGNARARICMDTNLSGFCRIVTSDTPVLGVLMNNQVSSLRVFTDSGAPSVSPAPLPVPMPLPMPIPIPLGQTPPQTYRSGTLNIASSFTADLDGGNVGGAGADLWHHAINAAVRRLEPMGDAALARGDGSNRGYAGCREAAFSADPVPFAELTEGTYVCVRTDQGRIAQFRVNGYTGTTLRIGFTTWDN